MSRARTSGPDDGNDHGVDVRLEAVTPSHRMAILALELNENQKEHLASNAESLAEARRDRGARPRAVIAGNRVIGFLMYDAGDDGEALLYRFMIDRRVQGRGYGRAALTALVREIEALGHVREIVVCYMPDNDAARRLYLSCCFKEQSEDEDGEVLARLALTPRRDQA